MREPQRIYRSLWIHLAGFAVSFAFVLIYLKQLLTQNGFAEWTTAGVWAFSLFLFLVVIPAGCLTLYLALTRKPLLVVGEDYVEVSSYCFPFLKARLKRADILDVKTDWVRLGGDQHSDLAFFLTAEAYEQLSQRRIWRKKNPRRKVLYWTFTNARIDPLEAVNLIEVRMSLATLKCITK